MILPGLLCYLFVVPECSAVTLVQTPPVLRVLVGQTANMSCEMRKAKNLQIVQYFWYLNDTHPDQILENSTRITIMSNTLIISSVTTKDTGLYVCTARDSNLHSYRGNGTQLQVQEFSAVTLVQTPPVLRVLVGQTANMSCEMRKAKNLQIVQYFWHLNDTHPEQILKNSTRITIMSNTLIISSVTTKDTGLYVCTARDSNVQFYKGSGTQLQVQDSPEQNHDHDHDHDKYLYYLLLLIPLLLILFIYRIFIFMTKPGAQKHGTKRRNRNIQQKKANNTDLHYSTIYPQTKGAQIKEMKTRDGTEEVEYAAVKIAVSSLSPWCTHETSRMDTSDITYATLKTEGR